MDKQKFEIKTDAIRAIGERFGFEQKTIGEMEKTKMRIAHPGWVEFSANIPKPEIQKLEIAKPTLPNVKKPETNVKDQGLKPLACGIALGGSPQAESGALHSISEEMGFRAPLVFVKRMELGLALPEIGENAKKRGQHKLCQKPHQTNGL